MTGDRAPRHARVRFPLAGDPEHGLGAVRVIDWGQPGSYTRRTLAGPVAYELGKDEEIETVIRTERLCGGCRSAVPDGQLIVELELDEGQQICGASYTLALVLADKIARGCLPRLAGRTPIASGCVKRDGTVAPVGRIGEKLAALESALARESMPAPLLVLSQDNLRTLSAEEQALLRGLKAATGLEWVGVAALLDMDPDWPPPPPPPPPPPAPRRGWPTARWLPLVLAAVLIGLPRPLAVSQDPCAIPSLDPGMFAYCRALPPVIVLAECRLERPGADSFWRACPSGTCLAAAERMRWTITSAAEGLIQLIALRDTGPVLVQLRPVRAGETFVMRPPGGSNHPGGPATIERFYFVFLRDLLPGLAPGGAASPVTKAFLDVAGEAFNLCRD